MCSWEYIAQDRMTFEEKTVRSEIVYKGKVLNLRRDEVITVSGTTSIREIVEHNGGVGLVAVDNDGQVIMVRQFRKAMERDMLEIPAGKLEAGEDPMEAALRELSEETGYCAGDIRFLTRYYPSVGYCQEALSLYLCTDLTQGTANPDDDEAIEIVKYPMEQLLDMIAQGKIEDGKTIAGITVANLIISKREKSGLR